MQSTHFEVRSGPLLVRKEFLYNLEKGHDEFLPAEIFAVTSYTGHVPTFSCIVDGHYLFHYLPINAFVHKEVEPISLEDANYFNCPSETIEVTQFRQLRYCHVYDKRNLYRDFGSIELTIEWPLDNELCHLVKLDSGHMILRPSHKIILIEPDDGHSYQLPDYKKLRHEWILKQ